MDKRLNMLIDSFGISGREAEVKKIIVSELKDKKCDINEDKSGNLIVKIGKGQEKIMICTHMDMAGLMVSYVEENGLLRVLSVGQVKAEGLIGEFVKFENGTLGRVGSQKNNPKVEDLFIDLGVNNKEEALNVVGQGSICTIQNRPLELGDKVISYGLSSRIGCYILLNMIENMKDMDKEIYFVFASKGQSVNKCARAAAFNINPDTCIVLDTIETGDVFGAAGNLKIEKGPVVSIMDRSLVINDKVRTVLDNAGEKVKVNIQYSISADSNEGGHIHKEIGGIKTAMVAVPCRYKNSISEMISKKDVCDVQKLLCEALLNL